MTDRERDRDIDGIETETQRHKIRDTERSREINRIETETQRTDIDTHTHAKRHGRK